ncbi:hypothetical protein ACUN0C_09375 [Faunimonas sp. B44]|uniref:hypothetical protein n=1 Tax=Faunimonas sp. B44 TaxID=3461493 RepID=UPI004043D18B
MLPGTEERVPAHTEYEINRRIARETAERIRACMARPELIERRLAELEREWDIERTLEANAATFAFLGTMLGALVRRRFLLLPAAVSGFLFQHATQGWCPPLPVLRRLGFRTAREIATERFALKALRGDFDRLAGLEGAARADAALAAVKR